VSEQSGEAPSEAALGRMTTRIGMA